MIEWSASAFRLLAVSGGPEVKAAVLKADAVSKLKRALAAGVMTSKVNEALRILQRK